MIQVLRRCRPIALALLLAAPGLGGTWLSVAHPCPVDTPWLAGEGGGHHGGGAHHGAAPADVPADTTCHCIGVCETVPTLVAPVTAAPAVRIVLPGEHTAAAVPATDAPVQRHLDRHPPPTAPPLV